LVTTSGNSITRDGVLTSYRRNDTRIRLRACYETRRVYCSSRRSAKVFSSGNANSINRKRFSAVDTWARGWHAHPRAEDAPVAAQRERAARARARARSRGRDLFSPSNPPTERANCFDPCLNCPETAIAQEPTIKRRAARRDASAVASLERCS